MLLETVLLLVSLVCLYLILRRPPNLPPGVWGLPVLGKLPSASQRFGDQVKALRPRYGDIITWRAGGRILVFLCNYKSIKRALSKQELSDRPDFATFKAFSQGTLRGVIVSSGATWQLHRRFVLRQLRNLGMGKTKVEQDIQEEAAFMVQDFKKHTNQDKPLPMSLAVAVINVIWKMVAGTRFNVDDTRVHDFLKLVFEMNQSMQGSVFMFNFYPWLEHYAPGWLRRKWGLEKLSQLTQKINNVMKDFVKQHQETFDDNHSRDLIDEYLSAMKDDDNHSDFSLENLYMLATDLFVAGAETTTNTLRWAVLYLAKYPAVQRRVLREIDDVLPRGTIPKYQDKARLPYFEAVLCEINRVVSLVPLSVAHMASEDTELEGHIIPKGTVLLPHLECIHKDPDLWERPNEFYPEHFLDKDGNFVNREGLMPFSVGRRMCVGESLARVELVIFLLSLLQNFTFTAPEGEKLSTENDPNEIVINAPKSYRITITERK